MTEDLSDGQSQVRSFPMATAWPPTVGARVRPVEMALETVSPEGDPIPVPGAGPAWSRLRYCPATNGNDRFEAMVAYVEDGAPGIGETHSTTHARASVVWNDGAEQDGLLLAFLGPCLDDDTGSEVDGCGGTNEAETKGVALQSSSRRFRAAAAAASARGGFRFRNGDFAAATAEYTEACAALLDALPARNRVLPGHAKAWRIPGRVAYMKSGDEKKTSTSSNRFFAVGARVRVLDVANGTSRPALVACVDDETYDVIFDDENDDEEEGVPFADVFGFAHREECDKETNQANSAVTETLVLTLADTLKNVARCHLRIASSCVGGGDFSSAFAAESAASASLLLNRSAAAYFLRGKARLAKSKFDDARGDLQSALRKCRREAAAINSNSRNPEKIKGDITAITAALAEVKKQQKRRRDADRKLARAILGHVHKEGKDLGLDPNSRLALTGYENEGDTCSGKGGDVNKKEGSVPIREVAKLAGETLGGKGRCALC